MKIRKLTLSECTLSVTWEPEEISVKGNVQVSEDPEADKEAEQWVLNHINRGNHEAWCQINVQVQWRQFAGAANLGCVSLDPDQLPDVQESIGQIAHDHDLVNDALADLNAQLEGLTEQIGGLVLQPLETSTDEA